MGQPGLSALSRAGRFTAGSLPVFVMLLAASAAANATVYEVTLVEHAIGRAANPPSLSIINPAPNTHPSFMGQDKGDFEVSCTYDDVTEALSCSGTSHFRSVTNPVAITGRVFDRFIDDLSIVGGVASATSYLCENSPISGTAAGGFGETVGANICGNYTLGGNFADDSTLTYTGTTVTRILAGDDIASGPAQSLSDYNLSVASFEVSYYEPGASAGTGTGGLILESANWDAQESSGTRLAFSVGNEIVVGPEARNDTFHVPINSLAVDFDVLANDSGFADPVTVTVVSSPANGTAQVTGSPGNAALVRISYMPASDFSGIDTFTYEVSDGIEIRSALVTVNVGANSTATVYQVTPVEHLIGRQGRGPSSCPINPIPQYGGDIGNIPSASCTYNPTTKELDCEGVIHIRSQVSGGPGGRLFDRLITDLNIVAGDPSGTTAYECVTGGFSEAVGADICGNYLWGENYINESTIGYGPGVAFERIMGGDDVIVGPQQSIHSYALHEASFGGTGSLLVLQSADWNQVASSGTQFSFAVGNAVTVPVWADARPDQFTVFRGSTATAFNVLANDVGFDDPVTVTVESGPANGVAEVAGTPGNAALVRIVYTPEAGFTGTDTFVYRVSDGLSSDTATVTVTVAGPVVADDAVVAKSGEARVIDVLANDSGFNDPLTVTITGAPANGTAVVTGSPGNASGVRIVYTPGAGYTGPDSLTYHVGDGINEGSATVSITVREYEARDDQATALRYDCCLYLPILENDVGFNSPVTVSILQPPNRGGSVWIYNSPGDPANVYLRYDTWSYSIPGDYVETFTYQVSDGTATDTATVTINVVSFIAADDEVTAYGGGPVTIPVTYNDLGFDYPRTLGIFVNPQHGSVVVNPAGSYWGEPTLTYTPAPGFRGVDTFQYAIDDGSKVGVATVTVTVIEDTDGDQVGDLVDNCTLVANANQRDTDGDGYGNACDGDLDNNGVVNFVDLAIFRSRFGSNDPHADFDGNGVVNFVDLAIFQNLFGKPPGPSALAGQ